ncbi:MAG: ABC transporter ATP-binding protein [Acidobacteria bacterium]|nr:MAG: ABC transporter ATP-binding protein [Acidobacteriota bacterium]
MLAHLRPLFPYIKKYRSSYIWGSVCVLLMNGIWVLFPLVIGRAIDSLKTADVSQQMLHTIAKLVGLILAVAGSKAIFQFLTRWIVIGVSREIEFDLRIRMLLGPAIMYSANTIVFTAGALAFMLSISPKLTLYAFLPLPIVSIVIQYFGRRIHERFEKIQAMFSEISARVQESFSGVRVVRAYVQERAETAAFEKSNREYIARSLKLVRLMGMLWPTLETMLGLAIVLVLWIGGREVINGQSSIRLMSYLGTTTTLNLYGSMTVGDFVTFNMYMVLLTFPVIALGWVINIFQRGTASLGRIYELMTERPEIADAPGVVPHPELHGDIEFRQLSFAYNGTTVLHDVNLRIPAGSSLAIVGPTGSGKTTLVSLIPRIYDADPGSVLIDGEPVRDYPLTDLRRNIGFVPQETFLFSETIRENIAFGVQRASDEEVSWAAEAANIATDIEGFPDKYRTLVGERGITLSGGQKQRTAIARALIRNPRILILDDALSSVDTQTEDKILNHLREVMHGRTTIFISHRVSTVRNADRIAVLHGGQIVELGSHDELLALNGYYTDLYNKQLLEEELAEV